MTTASLTWTHSATTTSATTTPTAGNALISASGEAAGDTGASADDGLDLEDRTGVEAAQDEGEDEPTTMLQAFDGPATASVPAVVALVLSVMGALIGLVLLWVRYGSIEWKKAPSEDNPSEVMQDGHNSDSGPNIVPVCIQVPSFGEGSLRSVVPTGDCRPATVAAAAGRERDAPSRDASETRMRCSRAIASGDSQAAAPAGETAPEGAQASETPICGGAWFCGGAMPCSRERRPDADAPGEPPPLVLECVNLEDRADLELYTADMELYTTDMPSPSRARGQSNREARGGAGVL